MLGALKKTKVAVAVAQVIEEELPIESSQVVLVKLPSVLSIFKKLEDKARTFQGLEVSPFAVKSSVGLFGTYLH